MAFIADNNGRPQIQSDLAFCELLENHLPELDRNFDELFSEMNDEIGRAHV